MNKKSTRKKKNSSVLLTFLLILIAVLAAYILYETIPDILALKGEKAPQAQPVQVEGTTQEQEEDTLLTPDRENQSQPTPDMPSVVPEQLYEESETENTEPEIKYQPESEETPDAEPEEEPEPDPGPLGLAGIEPIGICPTATANTDGDGTFSMSLATLELRNDSGKHITSANVTVVTNKGKTLNFTLEQIPSGYTVKAFDINNTEISEDEEIESISWNPVYARYTRTVPNKFQVTITGTCVRVWQLTIDYTYYMDFYFHALEFEGSDVLVGGKTYKGSIERMYPGQVVEFYIQNCSADSAVLTYLYPGYDGNEAE